MSKGKLATEPTTSVYPVPCVVKLEKSAMCTCSPDAASLPKMLVEPVATTVPPLVLSCQVNGDVEALTTVASLGRLGKYPTWFTRMAVAVCASGAARVGVNEPTKITINKKQTVNKLKGDLSLRN